MRAVMSASEQALVESWRELADRHARVTCALERELLRGPPRDLRLHHRARPRPVRGGSANAAPGAGRLARLVRALVQRVCRAAVEVGGEEVASIGPGLLVLLGVRTGDTP